MKQKLLFPKMLWAFLMVLSSVWGWGQTTIAFNGAEDGTPTLNLSSLGTWGTSSTNSGTPTNQRIKSGLKSFQSSQATGTATYTSTLITEGIAVSGFGSRFVELWNSSISSTTGNGIDATTDKLEVYVSETSTFSTIPDVLINASGSSNGNIRWGMNGTGVINATAGTPVVMSYSTSSSNGETKTGADAFSKIIINIPNSWSTVYIKIIAVNNANTEIWCVDDIAVKGIVNASTTPPTVTASTQTGTVGSVFSYQIQATESPTGYAVASGALPAGVTLNATTGLISGTPTEAGSFTANITATNGAGTSAPVAIGFTIAKGNQTLAAFVDQNKFLSSPAFTFPINTDNAGLPVTYTSSNPSVATISGNAVTITGVGTSNITATQAGNTNYNPFSQQIVLTVANDPVTYNGVGRFEKINSLSDLTDGYYVIADENGLVKATNSIVSGTAVTTNLNAANNQVVNPATNSVWNIVNVNGDYTIQNSNDSRYLSYAGSSTNLSLENAVTNTQQRWAITYQTGNYFSVANVSGASRILKYNAGLGTPGFKAYATTSQLPEVSLYKRVETTTWNGTSWSNGLPTGKDVIISGSYSTVTNPGFTAKNISVRNNGVLEITSGNTITANNVTVENGGNLIQRDGSALTYTGTFTVNKTGATAADKYVFWSSPVAAQNLATIYGAATPPAFITEYDTATNIFVNAASAGSSLAGKGYSVKNPSANAAVSFAGAPNTGAVTFTLNNNSFKYNLVGNPYPSDLGLNALYTANSANISSTVYFWDTNSTGLNNNPGYATANIAAATVTWTAAPNTTSAVPSGNVAKVGQGFIVKSLGTDLTNGSPLNFTNAMRAAETATFFNKNNTAGEGKYWLKLSSAYNTNNTVAVTYSAAASNAFDVYDSKAMGLGTDALYTTAGTEKVVIQGRAGFTAADVVPVGTKHQNAGNFTIALVQKEGIFDNGQAIYLHDKLMNTYTNLQNQGYTFAASAGELTDRFEIVYTMGVLATQEAVKGGFEIYRSGDHFVIRNSKKIESVEVYDAAGRKIITLAPNAVSAEIRLDTKGMYIVKAVSAGKEFSTKISN